MGISRGQPQEAWLHYAWVVTGVTCLALLAAAGARSSLGVFVQPLQHEFGWDRTAISVPAVLSMLLYGALGPLAGRLLQETPWTRPRSPIPPLSFTSSAGARS
jgi:hypothetical protein